MRAVRKNMKDAQLESPLEALKDALT